MKIEESAAKPTDLILLKNIVLLSFAQFQTHFNQLGDMKRYIYGIVRGSAASMEIRCRNNSEFTKKTSKDDCSI